MARARMALALIRRACIRTRTATKGGVTQASSSAGGLMRAVPTGVRASAYVGLQVCRRANRRLQMRDCALSACRCLDSAAGEQTAHQASRRDATRHRLEHHRCLAMPCTQSAYQVASRRALQDRRAGTGVRQELAARSTAGMRRDRSLCGTSACERGTGEHSTHSTLDAADGPKLRRPSQCRRLTQGAGRSNLLHHPPGRTSMRGGLHGAHRCQELVPFVRHARASRLGAEVLPHLD